MALYLRSCDTFKKLHAKSFSLVFESASGAVGVSMAIPINHHAANALIRDGREQFPQRFLINDLFMIESKLLDLLRSCLQQRQFIFSFSYLDLPAWHKATVIINQVTDVVPEFPRSFGNGDFG